MLAALVPLVLARVFTGRLLASSVVKVAADGWRIGLDRALHVAGYLHHLLHGADGQLYIHAQFLAHLKRHARSPPTFRKLGAEASIEYRPAFTS